MPLTISVKANDQQLHYVKAWNRGHPITGDHPDYDDLRTYEYESLDGVRGSVQHRRGNGGGVLAAIILADCYDPEWAHS